MKTLGDQLTNYANYHRDRRNIATHFVGIPMIVLAIAGLLSRPVFLHAGDVAISPATVLIGGTLAFYLALDRRFFVVMSMLLGLSAYAGASLAAQSTAVWLGASLFLFVLGWFIQFLGHFFEGKKPAFVDDLVGLLVGPLFVVAEVGFALGLRPELKEEIERRAGPTRTGRVTPSPAA